MRSGHPRSICGYRRGRPVYVQRQLKAREGNNHVYLSKYGEVDKGLGQDVRVSRLMCGIPIGHG